MKIFLILGVVFAYAQAERTVHEMQVYARTTCVEEKGLDASKIENIMKHDILPENDPEFVDFFVCYWKTTGVIKDDGTFDDHLLKVSHPELIKAKHPSLTNAEAEKLASSALDHCKDAAKGDSIGIKGIRYRNCQIKYVLDSQA